MHQTLHHHMLYLEDLMQSLNHLLTSPSLQPAQRVSIQKKISRVQDALHHYRQGFEIERGLRTDQESARS